MNSIGKAFGLLVAGVIVVSIGAPSMMGSGGGYLVMVALLGLVLWLAVSPSTDRGFRWLPGAGGSFSGRVSPNAAVIPRAVLLGSAVWVVWTSTRGSVPPTVGGAAVVGLVGGLAWGLLAPIARGSEWWPRMRVVGPTDLVLLVEVLIGSVAAGYSFEALINGDGECLTEGRPGLTLGFVVAVVGLAVAVIVVSRLTGRMVAGQFDLPAFALSIAALLGLVQFVLAPAGEDVVSSASPAQRSSLVAGFAVAILLTVLRPKVAELLLGYGVAIGGSALLVIGSSLTLDETHACRAYSPQLALVAAFTAAAAIGAGWRTR